VKSFSERLEEARKGKGFSQTVLADKSSVSLRTLQNWEGGKNEPQGKNLRNLCAALEMTIPELMDGVEAPGRVIAFNDEESATVGGIPTKDDCRAHLENFLDMCGDDAAKIAWTNIELQDHFPLNKWKKSKT